MVDKVVAEVVTKRCKDCGNDYPATTEWFYRNGKYLCTLCKTCDSIHNRKYRVSNSQRIKQMDRERAYKRFLDNPVRAREYAKNRRLAHPERIKEINRKWYDLNKDKVRQYNRSRYLADPIKVRLQRRFWRLANVERARGQGRKRRSLKNNLPYVPVDIAATLSYFNHCCAYCGCELDRYHLDHFIPLSSPQCPGTIPTNMIPACPTCNSSKHDNDPVEWITRKFGADNAASSLAKIRAYFSSLT